jgi:predicted nucleic acid-binding protein
MDFFDANILSELSRRQPDRAVVAWVSDRTEIAVSAVAAEEIHSGLFARPNPPVMAWFTSCLREHCQILPITKISSKLPVR